MDPTPKRLAIIVAMQEEAQPIIDALRLAEQAPLPALPMRRFSGQAHGVDIQLVTNGQDTTHHVENVGTVPAALSAYVSLANFKPDLLLNAGTAGGFAAKGAEIGDVFVSYDTICFHDRRIPLPGYADYGVGAYQSAPTDHLATALGLKQGIVSTGDSLDKTARDLEMMEANGADVKEMEAAAIAWVAAQFGVPFIAVKSITDLVDAPITSGEQFVANLQLASDNLCAKLIGIVQHIFLPQNV